MYDLTLVSTKSSFCKRGLNSLLATEMAKNVRPLCAIHPKKRAYTRYFYEAKYVSFLLKMMSYQKNVMKFEIKLVIL